MQARTLMIYAPLAALAGSMAFLVPLDPGAGIKVDHKSVTF